MASYGHLQASATPRSHSFADDDLRPPQGFGGEGYRDSYGAPSPSHMSFDSAQPLHPAYNTSSPALASKEVDTGYPPSPPMDYGSTSSQKKKSRPWWFIPVIAAAIVAIAAAVIIPVYFKVIKNNDESDESNSGSGSGEGGSHGGGSTGGTSDKVVSGGDGSMITTETGEAFQYSNKFGGIWYWDENDPYNNNAQAQSWSPPLNKSWDWQNDKMRGVNLGGWLVPEPFIVPALYEPYLNAANQAIDEWTLAENIINDPNSGGLLKVMEEHYSTFITEEDFARIAGAGLNWIRLPIGFWCIQTYDNEPMLEGVCWKYALKAFKWARKYGLRINLDLHAMPGSQNGYNHSGKRGSINFLHGVMGIANAQRGLDYQRVITEFITQPEYQNLIPMFGVMNEARTVDIGMDAITSYYIEMHDLLRNVTGIGEGKGPFLSIHNGFQPLRGWADFLPGKDRFALDTHPYMCFTGVDASPLANQILKPCRSWANDYNTSWTNFGVTTAGEWSLAINDCGYWINGVGAGTRYEGTLNGYTGTTGNDPNGCKTWDDYTKWDATTKENFRQLALASMDALQNWFFWTWRIGASSITGKVGSPFWSYSLGLEQGYMPTDPREALGKCGGANPAQPLKPIMTGGPGSGQISPALRQANPWPPAALLPGNLDVASLPTYTPTGPIPTLPVETFEGAAKGSIKPGNGWFNAGDSRPVYTPVAGCTYPNNWDAVDVAVPPACAGQRKLARNVIPEPKRTPAPL